MRKEDLKTPTILLNIGVLKDNIHRYQKLCNQYGKELWPMIKTHKSKGILEIQIEEGASGTLCGTLEEAEMCQKMGVKKIMYAYPVSTKENIQRVIELASKSYFIIRLDNEEGAKKINEMAIKEDVIINYTIIVDSGLHRFGVSVDNILGFAEKLKQFQNLKFVGISSHPGHVYSSTCSKDIEKYVEDECDTLHKAKSILEEAGYSIKYVTTGSTPTFDEAVKHPEINVYHPGNYVFLDSIQLSIGKAKKENCALTVYSSIISHPQEDLFICDAGAKCLGLDQGAHGNNSIIGYGTIIDHPELVIVSLSEEVGKIKVTGQTDLKVGDKIEIIPNHSCSSANLCSYYTVVKNGQVTDSISVDVRGNSFTRT